MSEMTVEVSMLGLLLGAAISAILFIVQGFVRAALKARRDETPRNGVSKFHWSHATSEGGHQCDRCGVIREEVSARLPCLYAQATEHKASDEVMR